MTKKKRDKESPALEQYRWIYDSILSKLYDFGMNIGLTPSGERILRNSVYHALSPHINRKDHVLDVGCGTGTLTILLAKLLFSDCEIIGVDLSPGQIAQARKKNTYSNLQFEAMDANNLLFKNERFDEVIISAALHEMTKELRLNVLREIHRVLKKGGYLLIFEHHEPSQIRLRILYNFYLGFVEKILSHSFEMQRNILYELKEVDFHIISQTPLKKFFKFFQIILCQK